MGRWAAGFHTVSSNPQMTLARICLVVMVPLLNQLTSNSYFFRRGERVLIYAWARSGGALSTLCSGSHQADENDPDLAVLRPLARGDAGGTVRVLLTRFDFGWTRYPGLRVTLRPRAGSRPVNFRTRTFR